MPDTAFWDCRVQQFEDLIREQWSKYADKNSVLVFGSGLHDAIFGRVVDLGKQNVATTALLMCGMRTGLVTPRAVGLAVLLIVGSLPAHRGVAHATCMFAAEGGNYRTALRRVMTAAKKYWPGTVIWRQTARCCQRSRCCDAFAHHVTAVLWR